MKKSLLLAAAALLATASAYAADPLRLEFVGGDGAVGNQTNIDTSMVLTFTGTGVEVGNLLVPYSQIAYVRFGGEGSGIQGVQSGDADLNAPVEWFDLSGRRIPAPTDHGIYITRQGSKTTKIAQ